MAHEAQPRIPLAPAGVWVPVLFFLGGGVLELACTLVDAAGAPPLSAAWNGLGRSLLNVLLAAGLWHRYALCRSVAIVYCLAAVVTHLAAVGLALGQAPLHFPPSVVVLSLYEVPSCLLLLPHLRSRRAAELFPRALSL